MADSVFIPELWSAGALTAMVEQNTVIDKINTDYKIGIGQGDTVKVRVAGVVIAEDGKATPCGDGIISGQSVIDMLIDQKTKAPVFIDNMDKAQNDFDLTSFYASEIGISVKQKMDTNLLIAMAISAATANKLQYTELVSTNTKLTFAGLLQLRKKLNDGKFPQDNRYLVVNPDDETALWNVVDDEGNKIFLSRDYGNSNSFEDGIIAKGLGFNVIMSTNLPSLTTTGTYDTVTPANNTKTCLIAFHKSAMAAAIQQDLWFEDYKDGTNLGVKVVGGSYWGRKVIRDTGIIVVRQNT